MVSHVLYFLHMLKNIIIIIHEFYIVYEKVYKYYFIDTQNNNKKNK